MEIKEANYPGSEEQDRGLQRVMPSSQPPLFLLRLSHYAALAGLELTGLQLVAIYLPLSPEYGD